MAHGGSRVHLVGPGGAGKSTVAPLLAAQLGVPAEDLDARFTAAHGDVDAFIAAHGYRAYVAANITTYLDLASAGTDGVPGVVALSSGFMVYPPDIHPRYLAVRATLAGSPTTVVLLPALELEACVTETVRRQLGRGPGRTTAAEAEAKIRERFALYIGLPARKVATNRSPAAVAAEIAAVLAGGPPPARGAI